MSDRQLHPTPGSPAERARFEELQRRLPDQFLRFRADVRQPYTAVVVPSQTFDPAELAKILGVDRYEERSLFNLMLLRRPRLELVLVTSRRTDPLVIDYYLHQMRGVPSSHARRRFTLLDCDDGRAVPLTQKILERPRLLQRMRDAIADPSRSHLSVFNATPLEQTLAVQLGIPLNASDPKHSTLGTKSGSRGLFRAAGLEPVPGRDGLRDVGDLTGALEELRAEPSLPSRKFVIKLEESFSGEGNARLDLPPDGAVDADVLARLVPEAESTTVEEYLSQFERMGGVVEAWIEGAGKTSPSVQMRVNPVAEVQIVSTHDQVLGGPSGQVFLAATFPAAEGYRREIQEQAKRIGAEAASRGVIGRFGIDFLVVPGSDGAAPRCDPLEVNLRQGGTTHTFNMLKFLTDGCYDEELGEFRTAQGRPRCYYATDNLQSDRYRGILPFDLLDQMVIQGVHFRSDETGVVFHLLGCLSEFGKLGVTAVASSVDAARRDYASTVRTLDEIAGTRP